MPSAQISIDAIKRIKERTATLLLEFTDQEMLHRPVPGANHAMWQVGHLTQSTWRMMAAVDPAIHAPEADPRFTKETARSDDATAFPSKKEAMELFAQAMDAAIAWAGKLSEADLAKPTPERMHAFAPTVGHLVSLLSLHATSHAGQYSVIRRALGKPVLF